MKYLFNSHVEKISREVAEVNENLNKDTYALSICTWFLKNQVGKIKFVELDF